MKKVTPLYGRYNGGMLGYFLSGAPARYASLHYPILRQRMNQFLEDLGCLPLLPPGQPNGMNLNQMAQEVLFMVRMQSELVADFAYLTCMAFHYAIEKGTEKKSSVKLKNQAVELMAKYGISQESLDRFETDVVPKKNGWISADELHSAGLVFLRALIEPLRSNKNTAFVAMPFSAPFDAYFQNFYTPLLAELNYNAIRAWGGLSHESYQQIIGTLIRKSGVMLADLTTLNYNVIHEVGLAEGMNKTVFLLAAKDEAMPPSNLGDVMIVKYDRSKSGWQNKAIRDCAVLMAMGKLGVEINSKR